MQHRHVEKRTILADASSVIREQRQYRELLFQVTRRDLLLRYKQAVLGFAWAIFMPVLNTVIFSLIFSRVAPLEVGMPYPLYAYTGLVAWNFFGSSLRFAVTSLTVNANLVTKVYFPREILPFASVAVCLIDFAVAAIPLAALMAYYGMAPHLTVVLLPVVLLVQLLFTLALALLTAMANLFFRDVKYVVEVVVQIWMFATAVLYPLDRMDGAVGVVLALNPMTPIIQAYRDVIFTGALPGPAFGVVAVLSSGLFAWSWIAFHRAEFRFAENA
jgi:ABC-type polysaccharide/polyol phosphate export permease